MKWRKKYMANVLFVSCNNNIRLVKDPGVLSISSYVQQYGHTVKHLQFIGKLENILYEDEFSPDVVGMSAYNDNLKQVFVVAHFFKQNYPHVKICLGGYGATYYYKEIFDQCPIIDFIVKGEGEETFRQLLDCLNGVGNINEINGLIYKDSLGHIIVNNDRMPLLNLELLPYKNNMIEDDFTTVNIYPVYSSRGCLNNCSFRYSHRFFDPSKKDKWRGMSPTVFVNELFIVHEKKGVNRFYIGDSSFEDSSVGTSRMIEIAHLLAERNPFFSFIVNFKSSIYRRISESELALLKKAGLTGVYLGIEAFNEEDLKLYKKGVSVEDNNNALKYFRERDIGVKCGFMNFNPYSDYAKLKNNALHLKNNMLLMPYVIIKSLRPYKGTEIYDKIKNDNLFLSNNELDAEKYVFINKGIEKLFLFLKKLFEDDINSNDNDFQERVYWYYSGFWQLVSHYRYLLPKYGVECDDIIDDCCKKIYEVLINDVECYFHWYTELLGMVDTIWNEDNAEKLVDYYNIKKRSIESFSKCENIKANMNRRILRRNLNCAKLLQ